MIERFKYSAIHDERINDYIESDIEIIKKEIATGEPKIYLFNQGNFQPKS